jgi:hypothetical protein
MTIDRRRIRDINTVSVGCSVTVLHIVTGSIWLRIGSGGRLL